eukprot:5878602-Prymnesium_polylepis.4
MRGGGEASCAGRKALPASKGCGRGGLSVVGLERPGPGCATRRPRAASSWSARSRAGPPRSAQGRAAPPTPTPTRRCTSGLPPAAPVAAGRRSSDGARSHVAGSKRPGRRDGAATAGSAWAGCPPTPPTRRVHGARRRAATRLHDRG